MTTRRKPKSKRSKPAALTETHCARCGNAFMAPSARVRYCDDCKDAVAAEVRSQGREYFRARRRAERRLREQYPDVWAKLLAEETARENGSVSSAGSQQDTQNAQNTPSG